MTATDRREIPVVKAHADGNDFLLVPDAAVQGRDGSALARAACDRHRGVGADGLIVYTPAPDGAVMRLWNPDGGLAEVSGNGVRCLAAALALDDDAVSVVRIRTDAGEKTLELEQRDDPRVRFRASMGPVADLREEILDVDGRPMRVAVMRVGNPQCVHLGSLPAPADFQRLGPALSTHPAFPDGTNVEFADVESAGRVRILIWERGVGPTQSSGTGSCAAAIAAAAFGGADRTVEVVAPGGAQIVEWTDETIWLTGWAEVVLRGVWRPSLSSA